MTHEVPHDIAQAVRGAAAMLPGYAGDRKAVERRVALRRRRVTMITVAFTLLVMASVVTPYVLTRGVADDKPAATPGPTALTVRPQRLLVSDSRVTSTGPEGQTDGREADPGRSNFGYPDGSYGWVLPGGVTEVLSDASLVPYALPAAGNLGSVLREDGSVVALSTMDNGKSLCAPGQRVVLEVWDSAASPSFTRELAGPVCSLGGLVDATDEEAFLWRGGVVVAHRFADGAERPVTAALGFSIDEYGRPPADVNLEAGLAAAPRWPGQCRLRVVRTSDAATVADVDVFRPLGNDVAVSCDVETVRVSPDGRFVAVTVRQFSVPASELGSPKTDRKQQVWLRIVDVASGTVVLDDLLYEPSVRYDWARDAVLGLAWSSPTLVGVAYVNLPEPQFGPENAGAVNLKVYPADDVLLLAMMKLPG